MKWIRRVKVVFSYPNEAQLTKLPKGFLVEIEGIKKQYLLELNNKLAKLDELQNKKIELDNYISVCQQVIEKLTTVSAKEEIVKAIEDQNYLIQQKEDERRLIEKEKNELKNRCDEIENHLSNFVRLHEEVASAFQKIEQERDQALNEKDLSQKDLKQLCDSHQQEVERINRNYQQENKKQGKTYQQEIEKLKSRLKDLESSDDSYHQTELRKDLLRKSIIGFYTVFFIAIISSGLSMWLTVSIIQDKRTYERDQLIDWEKLIALIASLGVTSTSVWLVHRDRRYENELNAHRREVETRQGNKQLKQQDQKKPDTTQE